MTERDRIMDAFRNCITEPKCKDCPWIECEELDNRKIEIPADLALAVMRVLTIDAIPMEWLEDRIYDMKRAPLYRRYTEMLLVEWLQEQKEQEAR